MTEQILDSFPELSRYDLSSFRVKDLNVYVKDKIIEKNPEFASLIWDDFSMTVNRIEIEGEGDNSHFSEGHVTLSITSEERKRYYKYKGGYSFNYKHIDTSAKWQTFFEGVHGKSFQYELKDKFKEKLQEAQTDSRIHIEFQESQINEDEVVVFIGAGLISKNKAGVETTGSADDGSMYLSANGIHIRQNIQGYWSNFMRDNYVWVKFAKEAIPEDQKVNNPLQPRDPNLDTRLNDAFAN